MLPAMVLSVFFLLFESFGLTQLVTPDYQGKELSDFEWSDLNHSLVYEGQNVSELAKRGLGRASCSMDDPPLTDPLDKADFVTLFDYMQEYAETGGRQTRKTGLYVRQGRLVFYMCNCAGGMQGPRSSEVVAFRHMLRASCGPGGLGWSWSQGWDKGYGIKRANRFLVAYDGPCPKNCLANGQCDLGV